MSLPRRTVGSLGGVFNSDHGTLLRHLFAQSYCRYDFPVISFSCGLIINDTRKRISHASTPSAFTRYHSTLRGLLDVSASCHSWRGNHGMQVAIRAAFTAIHCMIQPGSRGDDRTGSTLQCLMSRVACIDSGVDRHLRHDTYARAGSWCAASLCVLSSYMIGGRSATEYQVTTAGTIGVLSSAGPVGDETAARSGAALDFGGGFDPRCRAANAGGGACSLPGGI